MNIKILDCTLRDGGYVNNWEFSDKNISKIVQSLRLGKVDIIEYGYLNHDKGCLENSTIFTTMDVVNKFIDGSEKDVENVVMINLGDFDINTLSKSEENLIDGIRLAFHKKDLDMALKEAFILKELGYKVFFQPMVTKKYSDLEFLTMIEKVNKLNPYAFYIVDSFGSMTLKEFDKYLILSDNNLDTSICLGYHSHNNMQLAFSNAIKMCTQNIKREIVVDSSIYGIGRGAGNLNTELIVDFLIKEYNKNYETLPLLEVIDELLESLKRTAPWGFSPAQYLSASIDCHPNYATYLVNKNTNHIVGVKKLLEKLPEDKKSSFDKKYIEDLYIQEILKVQTSPNENLVFEKSDKILMIASGKTVKEYQSKIESKINTAKYTTIDLNHKSDLNADYYFFSNQKRFDEFADSIDLTKVIITSNIKTTKKISYVLDFAKLITINEYIITNSSILLLNYLIGEGFNEVEIAGMDGYVVGNNNYSYEENDIQNDISTIIEQNNMIRQSLNELKKKIKISLVTPSVFKDVI